MSDQHPTGSSSRMRHCEQCNDTGVIALYDFDGTINGAKNCPDVPLPWHAKSDRWSLGGRRAVLKHADALRRLSDG